MRGEVKNYKQVSSGGIQFFGIESVMEAYLNMRVPAFSIAQGKAFLMKYDGSTPGEAFTAPTLEEGQQILNSYLDALFKGSAIYTLKVYEDLPPGERLNPQPNIPGVSVFGSIRKRSKSGVSAAADPRAGHPAGSRRN